MTRIAFSADWHVDEYGQRVDPETGINARLADYLLIAVEPCHVSTVQSWGAVGQTHIVTIKDRRPRPLPEPSSIQYGEVSEQLGALRLLHAEEETWIRLIAAEIAARRSRRRQIQ